MSSNSLLLLEAAFERLKKGCPERTKNDGKISPYRVNREAGLSRGAINYYKDFLIEVNKKAQALKDKESTTGNDDITAANKKKLEALRQDRNNEKRLKEEYRESAKEYQEFADALVKTNTALAKKCLELQNKISLINNGNVVSI